MAMHPRRRNERGQAVDYLEGGEGEGRAPVGRGLRGQRASLPPSLGVPKTVGENAPREVLAEVVFHDSEHPRLIKLAVALERQPGPERLAHDLVQHRFPDRLLEKGPLPS